MIPDLVIIEQMERTLKETNYDLGKKYGGKVRDNYILDDKRVIVTTDRISCFDRVIGTIPFKGQVLNQLAVFWFNHTRDIILNHMLANPDPNVMVVHECKPLPVELVIRGYITGSLWRDYAKGNRTMYGIEFKDGLKKDEKFPAPIVTPSTKAEYGQHDEPTSGPEIVSKGVVSQEIYDQMEHAALRLFAYGSEHVAQNNLILVDTKYEFGMWNGKLMLMDEIHTPDSSRFWYADTYNDLFASGREQRMLDKEYVRQWLIGKGFMGNGKAPGLSAEVILEAAKRYLKAYEQITGQRFIQAAGNITDRLTANLSKAGYLDN
ncbi:MAG: phosphoribosylaminoimidazolesuccinocarboxamide synthase [archaeon]